MKATSKKQAHVRTAGEKKSELILKIIAGATAEKIASLKKIHCAEEAKELRAITWTPRNVDDATLAGAEAIVSRIDYRIFDILAAVRKAVIEDADGKVVHLLVNIVNREGHMVVQVF